MNSADDRALSYHRDDDCGKSDPTSPWPSCAWWCGKAQSCDQCHPNDAGYTQMAGIVLKGLGLQAPSAGTTHSDTLVVE